MPPDAKAASSSPNVGFAALAALFALLGTLMWLRASSVVDDARAEARRAAVESTLEVVIPALGDGLSSEPPVVADDRRTAAQLSNGVADTDIDRVRVWTADGALLVSTDPAGAADAKQNAQLAHIAKSNVVTSVVGPDSASPSNSTEDLLRTFVPIRIDGSGRPAAVAEFDEPESHVSQQALSFRAGSIALAAAAAILLTLAFHPAWRRRSAVDADDAPASPTQDQAAPATSPIEGTEKLRAKLEAAEASRRALDAQLEQLRFQVRSGVAEKELMSELGERARASEARAAELAGAAARVPELEGAVEAERARASELQARAAEVDKRLAEAAASAHATNAKLEAAAAENDVAKARIERLTAELEGARSAQQRGAGQAEQLARRLEAANARVAQLDAGEKELRAAVKQHEKRVADAGAELKFARGKLEASTGQYEDRIRQGESKLQATQVKLQSAERAHEDAAAETKRLAAELARAQRGEKKSSERADALGRRLESSTARVAELERAAADAQTAANTYAKNLAQAQKNAEATGAKLQATVKHYDERLAQAEAKVQATDAKLRSATAEHEQRLAAAEAAARDLRAEVESTAADREAAKTQAERLAAELKAATSKSEGLAAELSQAQTAHRDGDARGDELARRLEAANRRVEVLEEAEGEHRSTVGGYEQRMTEAAERIESMNAALQSTSADRQAAISEVERLSVELSRGEDAQEQGAQKMEELVELLRSAKSRIVELEGAVEEVSRSAANEFEQRLATAHAETQSVRAELEARTGEHEESLAEARRNLAALQEGLESVAGERQTAQAELERMTGELSRHSGDRKAVEARVSKAEAKLAKAQTAAEELRTSLANADRRSADAEARAAAAEERATRAEERVAAVADERSRSFETKLHAEQAARAAVETELARLQAVLEQAEVQARDSSKREDEIQANVARADDRARVAEERSASLDARIADAEARVEELRAESDSWRARLEQLQVGDGSGGQSNSNAARAEEEFQELRSEVNRLTAELARTIELRQSAEQRLATLAAELIARDNAEAERRSARKPRSNGNGHADGYEHDGSSPLQDSGSTRSATSPVDDAAPEHALEKAPAGQSRSENGEALEATQSEDPPPLPEDVASLRSRLARTAASKKGGPNMDRPRPS